MMQELCKNKFQRTVVPEGAINLGIQTIDAAHISSKTSMCGNIRKIFEERWY